MDKPSPSDSMNIRPEVDLKTNLVDMSISGVQEIDQLRQAMMALEAQKKSQTAEKISQPQPKPILSTPNPDQPKPDHLKFAEQAGMTTKTGLFHRREAAADEHEKNQAENRQVYLGLVEDLQAKFSLFLQDESEQAGFVAAYKALINQAELLLKSDPKANRQLVGDTAYLVAEELIRPKQNEGDESKKLIDNIRLAETLISQMVKQNLPRGLDLLWSCKNTEINAWISRHNRYKSGDGKKYEQRYLALGGALNTAIGLLKNTWKNPETRLKEKITSFPDPQLEVAKTIIKKTWKLLEAEIAFQEDVGAPNAPDRKSFLAAVEAATGETETFRQKLPRFFKRAWKAYLGI